MATVLPVNNPVHAPTLVVCHLPAAQANTAAYAALLDTAEQRRCRRLPTATAQARYMVSRALLRLELAACLGCRPDEVAFTSGEHGKPRLRDGSWHFNLSHSG